MQSSHYNFEGGKEIKLEDVNGFISARTRTLYLNLLLYTLIYRFQERN